MADNKIADQLVGVAVSLTAPAITWVSTEILGNFGTPMTILLLVLSAGWSALVWWALSFYRRALDGHASADRRERARHRLLQHRVNTGGRPGQFYARWLRAGLWRVEGFFGDQGQFGTQQVLWLRLPRPQVLWTAAAYDRCLFLALLYPLLVVFGLWVISGGVGLAEQALGLKELRGGQRTLLLLAQGFSAICFYKAIRSSGWRSPLLLLAAVALVVVGAGAGIVIGAGFTTGVFVVVGAFASAGAGLGAIAIAIAIAIPIAGALSEMAAVAFSVAVAFVLVVVVVERSVVRHGWKTLWLGLSSLLMLGVCICAPQWLAGSDKWDQGGVLLLFLGLLTLVNAPFDWLSLGLTRGLLHAGLQRGGAWPWLFALVDAAVACVIVMLLAIAMLLAVHGFNHFTLVGGGQILLPLRPLLDGLQATPTAPQFWWIYVLLLSTLFPSLLNLMLGAASLMRSSHWYTGLLQRWMKQHQRHPEEKRHWLPAMLALPWAVGIPAAVLVQGFTVWLLLGGFPLLGGWLLDLLGAVLTLVGG